MITAMPRIAIAMHDYEAALTLFRDGFGIPVADYSDTTVPSLGAHVGMCQPAGGSNIELMSPANPELPLSQAIQKFLDRRGEGFYALMLEAPSPDAEADELKTRGVDVLPLMAGAGGRDIHPRSTHGVLMRVYPDGSVQQPENPVSQAPGLSGIARVVIATTDAVLAADAYGPDALGLEVGEPTSDAERGVCSVIVTPPAGGVIELVSVIDASRPFASAIAEQVKERGEGIYALVLEAEDADPGRVLSARGVDVGGDDGNEVTAFGARFILS
jgi:hypothetical protein